MFDCECVGGSASCDCSTEARSYDLPEVKLKALTELMILKDVPVLVSPGKDAIEVHGTPPQHKIFGAFVKMIHLCTSV